MTLIQELLSDSDTAVRRDIRAFKEYSEGIISLDDCKWRWKCNNGVEYEYFIKISDEEFKEWLASIGWVSENG